MAKWQIVCQTGQFVFKVPSEFNGKGIYYNTKVADYVLSLGFLLNC